MNKLKSILLAQLVSLYGYASPTGFYWEITYLENKVQYKEKVPMDQLNVNVDNRPFTEEEYDPILKSVDLSFCRFSLK